jgi:hypothetical protein
VNLRRDMEEIFETHPELLEILEEEKKLEDQINKKSLDEAPEVD